MTRPAVGLLYNPVSPLLIAQAPDLVEYLGVMPDRLWYDFGPSAPGRRFHRTLGAIDELRRCAEGRLTAGHGIGLSLPSAMPLDEAFVDAVAELAADQEVGRRLGQRPFVHGLEEDSGRSHDLAQMLWQGAGLQRAEGASAPGGRLR